MSSTVAGREPPLASLESGSGDTLGRLDHSGTTIDGDPHPILQTSGGIAATNHRGDAVLPRDDRRMGEHTAHIRDDRRGTCEEWRPSWSGQRGDQDLAAQELVELARGSDDTYAPSRAARRCGRARAQRGVRCGCSPEPVPAVEEGL